MMGIGSWLLAFGNWSLALGIWPLALGPSTAAGNRAAVHNAPLFAIATAGDATVIILFGCFLFAISLFIYVFYLPGEVERGEDKTRLLYLDERKEATYENLRDLNFEYKAGKLSEEDYAMQRAALEDEAAAILAEMESIEKARASVRSGVRRSAQSPNGERA